MIYVFLNELSNNGKELKQKPGLKNIRRKRA